MANPLIQWLYSCDKIVKSSGRNVTHFMLDGGKLDLSEDYEIFQQVYAKNIAEKSCIVELKTDIFKLFIDFDVLAKKVFEIDKYIVAIQEIINEIYAVSENICIVTVADKNKKIMRDTEEYIKQGYHLHWPELLVNKEIAVKIRTFIVLRFTTLFGKIPEFYDNWEKIIDKSVYAHNGIRLLGADKCSTSDGIKNYENRVYIVYSVYKGKQMNTELTEEYKNDTLKALKNTSVRSFEKEFTKYHSLPEYEVEETEDENSGFDVIKKSTSVYDAIEKFFKNYATGYQFSDTRKIVKMKDKEIYIIESKSKFCQNIDDYHSNNHIFFKITPFGFCQRCRSERDGKFGCCREYASNLIPISITLQKALGWKTPKPKVKMAQKDFSINSLLEKIEDNITGKPKFSGPGPKKGKNK